MDNTNVPTTTYTPKSTFTSIEKFFDVSALYPKKIEEILSKLEIHLCLSDIERQSAKEIIDDWQDTVTKTLEDNIAQIQNFIYVLREPTAYVAGANLPGIAGCIETNIFIPELEFVIDKLKLRNKWVILEQCIQESYASRATYVQDVVVNTDTTAEEKILLEKRRAIDTLNVETEKARVRNTVCKTNSEIITAIVNDMEVMDELRKLNNKIGKLQNDIKTYHQAAQIAKINIAIHDEIVHIALAELVNTSPTV